MPHSALKGLALHGGSIQPGPFPHSPKSCPISLSFPSERHWASSAPFSVPCPIQHPLPPSPRGLLCLSRALLMLCGLEKSSLQPSPWKRTVRGCWPSPAYAGCPWLHCCEFLHLQPSLSMPPSKIGSDSRLCQSRLNLSSGFQLGSLGEAGSAACSPGKPRIPGFPVLFRSLVILGQANTCKLKVRFLPAPPFSCFWNSGT